MKTLFLVAATLVSVSAFAKVPKSCAKKAEGYVRVASEGAYDIDGINAYECSLASNKAAVICEVAASKGQGAATDSYRVVMNKTCSKLFRVELTGEE